MDPLTQHALALLANGHKLFGAVEQVRFDCDRAQTDLDAVAAEAQASAAVEEIGSSARPYIQRLARTLDSTAVSDSGLNSLIKAARDGHSLGQRATRVVLDDAHTDRMPAIDTPLGRREALVRMSARLRAQHAHIDRSRRLAHVLALRAQQVGYPHRRHRSRPRRSAVSHPLAPHEVRYDKSHRRGHIRVFIAQALNHLGIVDPAARRNWLRGYETLIARESGGQVGAVASAAAAAPGPALPDGRGPEYARGLTQTLPATFAHFHQTGTSTNIYDPVANICASINYVMHRYGVSFDGSNLIALVQQADSHRPPRGY